jgi:diacylglycerol O-acyltransferase / wax synthase
VALARLRTDELVNAWVGDRDTPFHVAVLGVFDGDPFARPDGSLDVRRIRAELAARVSHVPSLARRIVWTRPLEGRPFWADDPEFEVMDHLGLVSLRTGTDLASFAGTRIVHPLDLNRPPWRIEIVDGLPDGRFALIVVVHHLLADGVGFVDLARSLLDPLPTVTVEPLPRGIVARLPTHREVLRERLREIRPQAGTAPGRRAAAGVTRSRGAHPLRTAMAPFRTPEPITVLTGEVGPDRQLLVLRHPVDQLRHTARALGVTVNDLLLTAVTSGVRRLLTAAGSDVDGLVLRAVVPAATGGPGQVLGMLVAELPVGESDPLRRLRTVHASTTRAKARLASAHGDVGDLLAHVPPAVGRVLVRRARRLGSSRITLSVTDVIGPSEPLWLAGSRMLDAFPVAPLVPLVPVSVAALSYAGTLEVSLNADASVERLGLMAGAVQRSFAESVAMAPASEAPYA